MTEISKDILKSSHSYSPKKVRFKYCISTDILLKVTRKKWKNLPLPSLLQKIKQEGEKVYQNITGAEVTLYFTNDPKFRTKFYRDLKVDKAILHIEPQLATSVTHYPFSNSEEQPTSFCQDISFDVPESGFNAFDSYNAVDAQSYYDLADTKLYIYLKAPKYKRYLGLKKPTIENLSVTFGNGVTQYYLQENDQIETRPFTDGSGIAYRQKSKIPSIEKDFPSLISRFSH